MADARFGVRTGTGRTAWTSAVLARVLRPLLRAKFLIGSAVLLVMFVALLAVRASGNPGSVQGDKPAPAVQPAQSIPTAKTELNKEATVDVNHQSTGSPDVNVNINGEDVPVPENGSIHKSVPTDGGMQVQVKSNTSSSGNGHSSSSIKLRLDQHSGD